MLRSLTLKEAKLERPDADHVYLNVCLPVERPAIANAPLGTLPWFEAKYGETRSEPILNDPSEWHLSIVRFNCPTGLVPICFVAPQGGGGTAGFTFTGSVALGSFTVTAIAPIGSTPLASLAIGGAITGPGIPPATTISGVNLVAGTVTLSAMGTGNFPNAVLTAYPAPQADPNKLNYSVSLQPPAGKPYQAFLEWTSEFAAGVAPVPVVPNDPLTGAPSVPNPLTAPAAYAAFDSTPRSTLLYYSVYSYQHFVDLINGAFQAAYTAASADPLWPAGTMFPPFMTFDPATGLISITAETAYYTGGASICMNSELMEFFQSTFHTISKGFQGLAPGPVTSLYGADYVLQVTPTGTNYVANIPNPTAVARPGYRLSQEFASLSLWSDFRGLAFRTGITPVNPEFPASNTSGTTTSGSIPLITDFYPASSGTGTDTRSAVTYVPSGEYRLSNFISSTSLIKLDLSVFWSDTFDNYFPVLLTHNCCVNAKMMFRRRYYASPPAMLTSTSSPQAPLGGGSMPCALCASGGCASCGGRKKLLR